METREKYDHLLNNKTLYPAEFVSNFGIMGKHWRYASSRQKELSLRHDMCCLLLCGLEQLKYDKIIDTFQWSFTSSSKSSRSPKPEEEYVVPTKKMRLEEEVLEEEVGKIVLSEPDKQTEVFTRTMKSSEAETMNYRFWLIEGMPNPGHIQKHLAETWKCSAPDSMWDIADRQDEKFIEVKISVDLQRSIATYHEKRMLIPNNSALLVINPHSLYVHWENHSGEIPGLCNVIAFLSERKIAMKKMGLLDSETLDVPDLIQHVIGASKISRMAEAWLKDNLFDEKERVPASRLYQGGEAELKVVRPKDLF